MVPGQAPADVLPPRTPETPGANGFELLPATAGAAAAESSASAIRAGSDSAASATAPVRAAAPRPAVITDPSGFQMLAAPQARPAAPTPNTLALDLSMPVGLDAPAAPPALAGPGRLEPVSASAPLLPAATAEEQALPGEARLLIYPDFRLDLRTETPFLLPAQAPPKLVAAAPDASLVMAEDAAPIALAPTAAIELSDEATPLLSRTSAPAKVGRAVAPAIVVADEDAAPAAQVLPARDMAMRLEGPRDVSLARLDERPAVSAAAPRLLIDAPAPAPPVVHVLATTPVQTAAEAAPAIERFAAPSATVQAMPAVFVEPAAAEPEPRKAEPIRAAQLELGRDDAPRALAGRPGLELVAFVPTASVEPAPEDEPSVQKVAVGRPAPLRVAADDAPVATAPAPELDCARADLSLAPATASEAASAQTLSRPVSAVAAPPPLPSHAPQAEARDQGIVLLAQAAPPPPAGQAASPPAAGPAPAPSAPSISVPSVQVPAGQAAAPAAPAAAAAAPAPPPAAVVGRIIVQGNERIEASTILSYLPIQVGDTVDAAKLDLAVKTLHRTDLFADVSLEMQGSDLIVRVSENPIINEVVFEGNHALKEDKLRDEVSVRPRGIFTRSKVDEDAQKIIELYRREGRISATVTPKIVQLPQKRVDLIFEINEGPKSGILHINFVGNKSFSDGALRDVIVTRESHWYKFFQSQDNYDPDRIEYDREQLRKFYRNHGFYDFRIISAVAELAPDKNGFVVTFTVDEGPKYHFGKVRVTTQLKRLNGDLLAALLPIKPGQLYEDDRIEKATDALTYAAGANGFAFVDVRPQYVAHPETRTVDVTFDIKEGPRVYVERIDIVGNTQTLDYVIRREMRVAEGDAYNRVLVDRSKQQIKALGFFKDVDIEQLPGSAPDKTVLRVKVTEQPTGQLTFSIGYSSLEKLVGDIGISQTNFRGRGQRVDFDISMGYLQKRVQFSFTEPRFQGRNMMAGFDLYYYNYNYTTTASFSSESIGLSLRTGFPINQYAGVQFYYTIHSDKVTVPSYVIDPTTGLCTSGYSQSLCDELGTTFTSAVGYKVALDRRNDPILPTRGFYLGFEQEFAGLGGVRYIKTTGNASWYYGFTPKWVLTIQGRAGYITGWGGDIVRINDRSFMGGEDFRGFQIAGLGPRDNTLIDTNQCNSTTTAASSSIYGGCYGSALGGKAYAIGTIELSVPNPIPQQYGIKTALFTDFGTVGLLDSQTKRNPDGTINPYIQDNLAFRASVGISIAWKSPMGPLKFDFSKVIKKAPYDVTETFYFSTATNFQ